MIRALAAFATLSIGLWAAEPIHQDVKVDAGSRPKAALVDEQPLELEELTVKDGEQIVKALEEVDKLLQQQARETGEVAGR